MHLHAHAPLRTAPAVPLHILQPTLLTWGRTCAVVKCGGEGTGRLSDPSMFTRRRGEAVLSGLVAHSVPVRCAAVQWAPDCRPNSWVQGRTSPIHSKMSHGRAAMANTGQFVVNSGHSNSITVWHKRMCSGSTFARAGEEEDHSLHIIRNGMNLNPHAEFHYFSLVTFQPHYRCTIL